MPDPAPVIRLRALTVRRRNTTAISNLDLEVHPGDVVGLLGPNGAGKTTLLETIQGYHAPHSGSVEVFGLDPASATHELAARWGVMPQSTALPMGLTVAETVRLFSALHGSSRELGEVLAMTDLSSLADRRWRGLSGGEQQRLNLAIALCGGSDLLMLDEPTAAVDVEGRDRILGLIGDLSSDGSTIIMSTHRFEDVEAVASRVVMLDRGSVVADAPLDELRSDREHLRFEAHAGLDLSGLTAALGAAVEVSAGVYRVDAPAGSASVAALAQWLADNGVDATAIESGRLSLEDRYRELTGGDR